jgi:Dehydrogenases with different specificities (related to short-chain alcohol dehydrogenases)
LDTLSRFADQTAIVTGGSRGIGRAIALQLASEGACVVINYLQAGEAAREVVDTIEQAGGKACAFQADVSDENAVRRMVRFANKQFGHIHVLVANAGAVRDQLVGMMSLDAWETVIHINLRGPFLCIREVLPFMMSQKYGNIICLSSIAAIRAGRGHANYVAAKGGLNAMVRSLAVELAPKGIRVNAVAPGVILTDMTSRVRNLAGDSILEQIPLKRFGVPLDVAKAVCFLASEDASYITGEVLQVTGGFGL